jgi:ABC-type branched-subunit amino acid transport system substrate-binding protein
MSRRRFVVATGAALCAPALFHRAFAAAAGVGDREILLGQSAVISGPLGLSVKAFNVGAKVAFDEVNRRGGVNGRTIRVVTLDDELKPDKAVANYKALLAEHKVFAFFGGVGTGPIGAATPILRESNAPLIGNYAVGEAVREKAKGAAYFVRASYGRESERLVGLLDTIGQNRIAVAHLANPGGTEVLGLVKGAIKARNPSRDVVAAGGVGNDGSGAVETAKAIAAAQPQAVIMFLSGPPVAEVMKTVWASGAAPTFYGMSTVAGEVVAKVLSGQLRGLSIAQVVPYPWSEADAATREYRAQCNAAKVDANYYTYEGWLNAQVMIEGLRRAGRELTRDALHTAMRGLKSRWGSMDVDYTAGSATGSRLVELVHVRSDGTFIR